MTATDATNSLLASKRTIFSPLVPVAIPEDFIVIWLDPVFDNTNECLLYTSSIKNEKIFLIVFGALGETVVPLLQNSPQILSIFIFCENREKHEQWFRSYSNIRGIFTELNALLNNLEEDALLHKVDMTPMMQNASFTWFRLLIDILLRLPQSVNTKKDLMNEGRVIIETTKKNSKNEETTLITLGDYLLDLGEFTKAERYYTLLLKELPLTEHPDIEQIYNNIDVIYCNKCNYENALKYHHMTLELRLKYLSDDNSSLILTPANIGSQEKKDGQ
ncbi:unnamed protein product [Didymodactylos carnosus]|uniref:Uncharacterized protein n=1 Tax=Didymodactylos carnosus TaxID=1234261 RepID=A0A815DQR0_9BILA|nr:unnamed protein product [Didymodactylos carnosus]CAF4125730.1 unnamed protein product [Didymodactylos carnosus]